MTVSRRRRPEVSGGAAPEGEGSGDDDHHSDSQGSEGSGESGASADSGQKSNSSTPRKNVFDQDIDCFDPEKWRGAATRSLLQATNAVDQLCHAVVSTKPALSRCTIATEIRRLALTVAVFERSLFAYALGIKRDRQQMEEEDRQKQREHEGDLNNSHFDWSTREQKQTDVSPGMSSRGSREFSEAENPSQPGVPAMHETPALLNPEPAGPYCPSPRMAQVPADLPIFSPHHAYLSQLEQTQDYESLTPRSSQHKSMDRPRHLKHAGGMVSLLRLLTRTLNATTVSLNKLAHENSFAHYVQHTKMWLLFPLVWTIRGRINDFFGPKLLWMFEHSFPGAQLPSAFRRFSFFSHNAVLLFFFYLLYQRSIQKRKVALQLLHSRLGILLRLWHICVSVIDSRGRDDEIGEHGQVAISQWMLELVPPSLDSAFWYQSSNWQLSVVKMGMDILYSSVSVWYNLVGDRLIGVFFMMWAGMYYAFRPRQAAAQCSILMGSPDIRFLAMAWRTHDTYLLPKFIWLYTQYVSPFLGLSRKLAVLRKITLADDYPNTEAEMLSPLRQSRRRTINVLLMSVKPLDISINPKLRSTRSSNVRSLKSPSSPIIIYLHGGGMITDFRSCHLTYLKRWAENTGAPILYVDYSLAPENAYPTALDECYDVFKWVSEGRLGIDPSNIILAGDSIGGNLAVGVCLRAIEAEERTPDGLFLAYPILNLRLTPTPSRTLFMMDPILPMNVLLQCRSVYLPSQCDANRDPCLSPVVARDELLCQMPPTSIMVGGFDPFVDDSVDFAHRLHANGVPCRLKVYKKLPHSFLNFAPFLPDAHPAMELASSWLQKGATTKDGQPQYYSPSESDAEERVH